MNISSLKSRLYTKLNAESGFTRDCMDPWNNLEISTQGDVCPCCNIHQSFAQPPQETIDINIIRNQVAFRSLRESLLNGNLRTECEKCHIRKTIPISVFKRRVQAELNKLSTEDLLQPLPLSGIRIDINGKCNLRCDYCAVSSPSYHADHDCEMTHSVFEFAFSFIENEPQAIVHVNGHGETTIHPNWYEWCERIVESGHRPLIITNLAKNYTEVELELLANFHTIQVSLDSDDAIMMKKIRKAVKVERIFDTIEKIRKAAKRQSLQEPLISFSIGVYDPSIWTLEKFIDRLIGNGIASIVFWNLVEYSHQKTVSGLNRLNEIQKQQAINILGRVRKRLLLAEIPHYFAGDLKSIIPEDKILFKMLFFIKKMIRSTIK
jgi:sulfatase maturation enzyme AslB (radical SAM superfamily)